MDAEVILQTYQQTGLENIAVPPASVYNDKSVAISIAAKENASAPTKFIDLRVYHVR